MTAKEIYKNLKISPNLQEHMLRVAALLKILSDNWQGDFLDAKSLIKAGLCHDLGNILKFNFALNMMGNESGRVDYWKQVQQEVRTKYGTEIHQATLKMGAEVGLDQETLRIIHELEWDRVEGVINKPDWPVALAIYADMRIGPFGILPISERVENLNQRRPMQDFEKILTEALKLETIIAKKVKIDLQAISAEELEAEFARLLIWEVSSL